MPNPNDHERAGDKTARSTNMINSASQTAARKLSWSEWFGGASDSWLGRPIVSYLTDMAYGSGRQGAFLGGLALATWICPPVGVFAGVVAVSGVVVAVDVFGKKLEDVAKENLPAAIEFGRQKVGRMWFGGSDPSTVLNRPLTSHQTGLTTGKESTLEDTLKSLKDNCALIQDLLNKVAGRAGKSFYCDDVYQIAVLADKLDITKAEVFRDVKLLRLFLDQLESDLNQIKSDKINESVKQLAEEVCDVNDGRHWDNAWTFGTVMRVTRCSKEHCYGPKA